MKKSFALFIVLVAFVIGGTCFVNAALLEEKDNVQITETVVYGDKSVVEGVTIERNTKYDDVIRWNTTYAVGEEPDCKTEYTFDSYGRLRDDGTYRPSGIEMYTNPVGSFDDEAEALELIGLDKAMRELLDETAPGEEKSMVIDLADYLDYYVYEVHIDLPGDIQHRYLNEADIEEAFIRYNSNDTYMKELEEELHIVRTLTEFFKIPVVENNIYEISVVKDMNGNLQGWGYGSATGGGGSGHISGIGDALEEADAFDLWIISDYTEDVCYLTFNNRTWMEEIVDTSYIPGGYGIYSMPFDRENRTIDVDSLKMVYSLDPSSYVITMQLDAKQENLLLFTEEEDGCVMTVIDVDSMQTKQQIVYSEDSYNTDGCYTYEDFMVLLYAWDKAVVLSIDENGAYHMEMTLDFGELIEIMEREYYVETKAVFDWNGETLIMSDSLYDGEGRYYEECGFFLAAFDETGLIYYGEYESSLDTGKSYDDYYYNCMPTETDSLTVSW